MVIIWYLSKITSLLNYINYIKLYKNLDTITNKATEEEMKGVKHHLIGYLDSTCMTNVVTDYKNKAVSLVITFFKTIHHFFEI